MVDPLQLVALLHALAKQLRDGGGEEEEEGGSVIGRGRVGFFWASRVPRRRGVERTFAVSTWIIFSRTMCSLCWIMATPSA